MRQIASIPDFIQWCAQISAEPVAIENLPLHEHEAKILAKQELKDVLFLGCSLTQAAEHHIMLHGGVIFPQLESLPFNPYRHALYTPSELFEGFDPEDFIESFKQTPDQRIYAHFMESGQAHPGSVRISLAQSLHDHAVTDAKLAFIDAQLKAGKRIMAIMGGHKMQRASAAYRQVALIARELTRQGFMVATGGGPGAMEAAHFGAYMAPRADDDLDQALERLGQRLPEHIVSQDQEYADKDWMRRAFMVWQHYAQSEQERATYPSLGIPTWLYGHEPPTIFATHHAKYFANAIREDGLLSVAIDGVLYTPGRAGTVQEIFQDACQNYYGSMGFYSPMIFMDTAYWREVLPAQTLLDALMKGKRQAQLIHYEDDAAKILEHFLSFDREQWRS